MNHQVKEEEVYVEEAFQCRLCSCSSVPLDLLLCTELLLDAA